VARLARAAAVGDLASSIARELSAPLRAVLHDAQAALKLVAKSPPELESATLALEAIAAHARRSAEALDAVLSAVGRGAAERCAVHLEALARDVARLLAREAAARGVALAVEADAALPPVVGDREELRGVLAHLVARALEGASVGAAPRRPGQVQVRVRAADSGAVRIDVSDTGPALPAEAFAAAFDPLFTMGVRGVGAGLALCRAICEAHGGSLELLEGDGGAAGASVVAVTLPGAARPPPGRDEGCA
jgi:signal transduction histidine kinase